MLPVAGVAAQSKQIVVKALNRFLLQHVVDSTATVQSADWIVFIKWRLCHWRHCTHARTHTHAHTHTHTDTFNGPFPW